jgi:hypothetical protein
MGEKQNRPFHFSFNSSLKVGFLRSRITSDAGLLLVRELDERLGLTRLICDSLTDWGICGEGWHFQSASRERYNPDESVPEKEIPVVGGSESG